ncbi:MAG TPA: hypothetical protein VKU41_27445 [Polyangiaceae bacterium]|nr:hypothetical protein [Polyangiaceae bacterium]
MKFNVVWLLASASIALFGAAAIELVTGCGQSATSGGSSGSLSGGGSGNGNLVNPNGDTNGGSGSASTGSQGPGGGSATGGGGGTGAGSTGGRSGAGSTGGSTSGSAQGGPSDGGTSTMPSGTSCLQTKGSPPDYSQPGPYKVATKMVDLADAGLPSSAASPTTYTIYYPSPMDTNCLHPIAAWGNGTGVTGQMTYQFYNNNAASWGIVTIASDNSNVAGSPYLATGIEYLIAQNKDPSSIFYQKLSTKAGVAGHSQGGIAATAATMDPNVVGEVCIEGGGTPRQGVATLCLTGSITDGGLNPVNAGVVTSTYPSTTGPAFLADWDGGDHVTTPTVAGLLSQNPQGTLQFVRLLTAWYRCFLADDGAACNLFKGGKSCGICKDPGWYLLESKNL